MSDHQYQGLCVGGPLAGQHRICESRTLVVELPLEPVLDISAEITPETLVHIETFVYQHVTTFYGVETEAAPTILKFWVPITERHPRLFAMQEMVRVYEGGVR